MAGSAGFREVPRVPQGSVDFLKDLPYGRFGRVPQDSAARLLRLLKVPRRFRKGSTKVLQGSA